MTSKRVQALVLAAAVAGGIRRRGRVLGLGAALGRGRLGLRSGRRSHPLRPHRVLRRRRRPAARPDRHGRRRQRPAAQRRPRPGGHRRASPRRRSRSLPGVADAEFSPSVPVLGTVTDPYFPQYGYNLDNTGTNSYNSARSWPTPTSTPPRAGPAAPATAGSSPSSTPATTPTTPSSRARCGPTRPSPAGRPTPTATARPATATAGTSRPTRPTSTTAPTARTARASPASSAAGRATAWAPRAWPRTSRSCRWSSAAVRRST